MPANNSRCLSAQLPPATSTMADVKMESSADIKPDPDSKPSPATSQMDLDADRFEDDLDTYVPPKDDQGKAWLVRLPADMWVAWNSLYQAAGPDELVEIGKLRVYENGERIQMSLDPKHEQHKNISRDYNLNIKSHEYKNSVAFSEKDRKDAKGKALRPPQQPTSQNSRYGGVQSKFNRYGPPKRGGAPGTGGGYRSSIPKQTALAPQIANEAVAVPVDDLADFQKAYAAALKPKNATVYEARLDASQHPGGRDQTLGFSFSSRPAAGGKVGGKKQKKEQKDKAVRMERGALFDALSKCFAEFKYWSLRALRTRLRQPEAYIKEALDDVAVLVRSGDFAMTYKLKPEFEAARIADQTAVKDEVAPQMKSDEEESDQGTGDEAGSDDDDPMDFEEVKLEGKPPAGA